MGKNDPMTTDVDPEVEAAIAAIYADRDRDHMAPTIEKFESLLAADPENARLIYEVGGAYDTAGDEERALPYYERALAGGLGGAARMRCLLQYGSTLRNLERHAESVAVLERAVDEFPESTPLRIWLALSLHAAGRSDRAVADLMEVAAAAITDPTLDRYRPAVAGNAEYLRGLDSARSVQS
ncbi:hypothetical protein BH11ACT3_BH11ACT3_21510 [soil metagenome]